MSGVIGIAVHHSVTTAPVPATNQNELAHIRAIDEYHVGLDYGGFGYHVAVFPSGNIYLCGDLDGARAHVADRNNELVGIVAIGTFTNSFPSTLHFDAILNAIRDVRAVYGRELEVRGHNLWAKPGKGTECAGKLNTVDWPVALHGPLDVPANPPTNGEPVPPTPRDIAYAGGAAALFVQEGRSLKDLHPYDQETLRWLGRQLT